jgi:predicted AAA+ superfamily ATPase
MQELLSKIDMPRTAYSEVYYYLELLQKAKVLRLIKSADKKDAILTKPEKIYLNNTNLHFCYCDTQEIGSIREVFFASMFDGFKIYAPKKGDFVVNGYIFEIGGKNKTKKQIKEIENSFVVRDNMEIGSNRIIPLWLFGFLY